MKWNNEKACVALLLAVVGCSEGGDPGASPDDTAPSEMSDSTGGAADTGEATAGSGATPSEPGAGATAMGGEPLGSGGAENVAVGSGGSGDEPTGTGGDDSEGWVPIFDGLSTEGWEPHAREPTVLEAVDGELHLDSARNLWVVYHPLQMSDFEAEAEVHFPEGATEGFNTGFGFRMPTDANNLPTGGYQLDLDNGDPSITGALHVVATTYVFPPGGNRQNAAFTAATDDLFDPSDWIRMRVRAEGDHIQLWVNDRLISDVDYEGRTSGAFGIQHHGGPSGAARFRNLRAREL